MSLKRRTAAGRQAFEKAWDLAVVNERSVLQSDIDHILQERFNGDPEWEYLEMQKPPQPTQEELNKVAAWWAWVKVAACTHKSGMSFDVLESGPRCVDCGEPLYVLSEAQLTDSQIEEAKKND